MQLGVFLGVNAGRASDVGGADDPSMHAQLARRPDLEKLWCKQYHKRERWSLN